MTYALRVVAYTPNGARLGVLPAPSKVAAGFPMADLGALTLDYALASPKATLLDSPVEVAVEVQWDNTTWVEPLNGRFLRLQREGDQVARPGIITYTMPSYGWRLTKARVLPEAQLNADGKRPFLSKTPGAILAALTAEAQARGALEGLDFSTFSATADSAGRAWPSTVTLYYEPGLDYFTVIQNLADQGLIDWAFQGRSLRVWVADAEARSLDAAASPVVLRDGRDVVEAPFRGTIEGLADYVFLLGDEGASLALTNAQAIKPWGRWETFIQQGGVSDPGTMQVLAQGTLDLTRTERVENTYGLSFGMAKHLPFRDYRPLDYVGVAVGRAAPQRMRVQQVTLERDADGVVKGNAVLNDRFLDAEVRVNRRVQGIVGGALTGGASGGMPVPVPNEAPPDTVAPGQVGALTLSGTAYLNSRGESFALVQVSWPAVTKNADGTDLTDLAGYRLWVKDGPGVGANSGYRVAAIVGDNVLTANVSPLPVNTVCQFYVEAFDTEGNLGAASAVVQTTTPTDTTAPPKPSAPTVASYLGTLRVTWDGTQEGGGGMPADFSHVEVWVGTIPGFTIIKADGSVFYGNGYEPSERLYGGGSVVLPADKTGAASSAYGSARYVRLVAVDKAGNRSPESVEASATLSKVVTIDLGPQAVDSAAIKDLSVLTAKINDLAVNDAKVGGLSVGKITAGALSADVTLSARIKTADTGSRVELSGLGLQAFDGQGRQTVLIGTNGGVTLSLYDPSASSTGSLVLDSAGLHLYDPTGVETILLSSADGSGTFTGSIQATSIAVGLAPVNNYATTFSATAAGAFPTDWRRGLDGTAASTDNTFTALVQAVTGTASGKVLRLSKPTTGANLIGTWYPAPEATVINAEVYGVGRITSAVTGGLGNGSIGLAILRMARLSATSTRGYVLCVENGNAVTIRSLTSGGSLDGGTLVKSVGGVQVNTWYKYRLRVEGNTVKAKVWAASGAEPASWVIGTDSANQVAGQVGVGISSNSLFSDNTTLGAEFQDFRVTVLNGSYNVDGVGNLFMGGTTYENSPFAISSSGVPRVGIQRVVDWTALPLASGWAAYGSGFLSPQYCKDATGRVFTRGLVKWTGTAATAANATIGTIPAGLVPTAQVLAVAQTSGGPSRIDVQTTGVIYVTNTVAAAGWVSLETLNWTPAAY